MLAYLTSKSTSVYESTANDVRTWPQVTNFNLLSFVKTIAYLGGVFLDKHGTPVPDSNAPHTQLGTKKGRNGDYTQAREFDANGKPTL